MSDNEGTDDSRRALEVVAYELGAVIDDAISGSSVRYILLLDGEDVHGDKVSANVGNMTVGATYQHVDLLRDEVGKMLRVKEGKR